MKTLALLGVLLLVGCGRALETQGVQAEFTPYLEAFDSEAQARGVRENSGGISIGFGAVPAEAAAFCRHETSEIAVDAAKWAKFTSREREIVIFHELGHCVLGREHDDRMDGWKALSLMNSRPLVGAVDGYPQRRTAYVDELFGFTD